MGTVAALPPLQVPMVKQMKRSYLRATWTLAALLTAGALWLPACSSKFSSCRATRTCIEPSGGSTGDAGAAGSDDQAGGEGESAGSSATNSSGSGGSSGLNGASAGESATSDAGASGFSAAGAAGAPGDNAERPINGSIDNIAPTILSITPANGATKLTLETSIIVITFSEPMNKASAQSAFVAAGGATAAAFKWNAAGTELTIDAKLVYPNATDPMASAEPFKFSVTTAAKDLEGNPLAAAVNSQFTLLREITQVLTLARWGSWMNGAGNFVTATIVGDHSDNGEIRGFIGADIASLPAGIEVFESATIDTTIGQLVGDPFGRFGNMVIQSVTIPYPYRPNQTAFDATALQDLGTFISANGHNASGDAISKDVLTALKDDYKNRGARDDRSIFRLRFPNAPKTDSVADAAHVADLGTSSALTVQYLYP